MVSSFGGAMALYLGVAMIMVFEVIEISTTLIIGAFRSKKDIKD